MEECKLWPGGKDKDGYGRVKIHGRDLFAHRIALEIKIGRKLNRDEVAMHLCDNPPCFNPNHLKVGNARENKQMERDGAETLANKLLSGWKDIYL